MINNKETGFKLDCDIPKFFLDECTCLPADQSPIAILYAESCYLEGWEGKAHKIISKLHELESEQEQSSLPIKYIEYLAEWIILDSATDKESKNPREKFNFLIKNIKFNNSIIDEIARMTFFQSISYHHYLKKIEFEEIFKLLDTPKKSVVGEPLVDDFVGQYIRDAKRIAESEITRTGKTENTDLLIERILMVCLTLAQAKLLARHTDEEILILAFSFSLLKSTSRETQAKVLSIYSSLVDTYRAAGKTQFSSFLELAPQYLYQLDELDQATNQHEEQQSIDKEDSHPSSHKKNHQSSIVVSCLKLFLYGIVSIFAAFGAIAAYFIISNESTSQPPVEQTNCESLESTYSSNQIKEVYLETDEIFYTENPEFTGYTLERNNPAHQLYREQWCIIADELLSSYESEEW